MLGVQAELADAMVRSWQAGRAIHTETAATYADGIAARVAIPEPSTSWPIGSTRW